jgi:FixJ family two-component response regulator
VVEILKKLPAGMSTPVAEARTGRPDNIISGRQETISTDAPAGAVVFLVDDDEATRTIWCNILAGEGFTVKAFESAEAFLDTYHDGLLGCLVTDVGLPGMNGLELQGKLREVGATIPVIVVTGRRELRIAALAAAAGAIDVLEKPVASKDFVDAVRRAIRAKEQMIAQDGDAAALKARYADLTPREREIMALIIQGCANKEVAYQLSISQRTVEGHRGQIMRKMRADTFADLVLMGQALKINDDAPHAG